MCNASQVVYKYLLATDVGFRWIHDKLVQWMFLVQVKGKLDSSVNHLWLAKNLGTSPHPVTINSRILSFLVVLVGNPNQQTFICDIFGLGGVTL